MSAHTPGPWLIYVRPERRPGAYPAVVSPSFTVRGPDNRTIAACADNVKRSQEESFANARLIAAAPELLRRLCDLVEGLEGADLPGAMPVRLEKANQVIAEVMRS